MADHTATSESSKARLRAQYYNQFNIITQYVLLDRYMAEPNASFLPTVMDVKDKVSWDELRSAVDQADSAIRRANIVRIRKHSTAKFNAFLSLYNRVGLPNERFLDRHYI